MKAELEKLKEEEKLLRLRNEEDKLRREMVERRKNVNKLRGNSPPNIARDKQSKHIELSDKSLNIDKLRGNKQLRKLVKKELFSIGLVNSGDSASAEASNIESEAEFVDRFGSWWLLVLCWLSFSFGGVSLSSGFLTSQPSEEFQWL